MLKSKSLGWFVFGLLSAMLMLSACQTASTDDEAVEAQQPALPIDSDQDSSDVIEAVVEVDGNEQTTTIAIADAADIGQVLVDGEGFTLYLFMNDEAGVSNCTGGCTNVWPPMLTEGELLAGDGLDANLLGTITREDGSTQVTYNDHPLYRYAADTNPGDVNGAGVGGVWFPISPTGEKVAAAAEEEEIDY